MLLLQLLILLLLLLLLLLPLLLLAWQLGMATLLLRYHYDH